MTGRLGGTRYVLRHAVLLVALALLPTVLRAQDEGCPAGEPEVRSVEFVGNDAFSDADLAASVATAASSWTRRLPISFGTRRCLDPVEYQRDVIRLRVFYRLRGYYKTQVDTATRSVGQNLVAVQFRIAEGPPARIAQLTVTGLDSLHNSAQLLRLYDPLRGAPFSRVRIEAVNDTVLNRLRNEGFAFATAPLFNSTYSADSNRATVELDWITHQQVRIDTILVAIEPSDPDDPVEITPSTVRDLITLEPGELYRQRDVLESQRVLYGLDAYRHIEIALAPDSVQPKDSTQVAVAVELHEGDMHTVRAGVGAATVDCIRTQAHFVDRDFLGGARRLELDGRISKIGASHCPVSDDPLSLKLNYYAGATLRLPFLFGARVSPSFTLFSERRSEYKAYLRTTRLGASASVTRNLLTRTPVTLAYQYEYGQTLADSAVFCFSFNVCDVATIQQLKQFGSLHVASATVTRDRTDNALAPTRGYIARVEARYGITTTGVVSNTPFNRLYGELSGYHRLGSGTVLAARVQAGGVLVAGTFRGQSRYIPPQERLYAGGPNSMRGYYPNQLGPVVYVFDRPDQIKVEHVGPDSVVYSIEPGALPSRASPTGGNALFVTNLELRMPSPFLSDYLSWAAFVDAGNVWNRQSELFNFSNLRYSPGIGVRIASFIGPIRVDVAYNPYRAIPGPAYYVTTGDPQNRLFVCVSPGAASSGAGITTGASCPGYTPPERNTFRSHLRFQFNLGEAF